MRFFLANIFLVATFPFLISQDLRVTYAGNNLWNPGLAVGAEWPIGKSHRWHVNGGIGGYWDPESHTGTYLNAGLCWMGTEDRAWRRSLSISPLGLYRSWLPETWLVYGAGNVVPLERSGNWSYAPAAFLRLHHDTKHPQIQCFAGVGGMLLMPYNDYVLPLLMVEAGLLIKRKARPRRP